MSNPNVNKIHFKNSICKFFKTNQVPGVPPRNFRPELGGHRYQSAFPTEHDYFMHMEQTGKKILPYLHPFLILPFFNVQYTPNPTKIKLTLVINSSHIYIYFSYSI